MIDQLRAIDNARLIRGPLATLEDTAVAGVDEALRNVLELVARTQAAGGEVEKALAPDEPPIRTADRPSRSRPRLPPLRRETGQPG